MYMALLFSLRIIAWTPEYGPPCSQHHHTPVHEDREEKDHTSQILPLWPIQGSHGLFALQL